MGSLKLFLVSDQTNPKQAVVNGIRVNSSELESVVNRIGAEFHIGSILLKNRRLCRSFQVNSV